MGGQKNENSICRLQKLSFEINYIRFLKENKHRGYFVLLMGGNLAHIRPGETNPVVWKRLKEQERTHLLKH